MAPIFSIFLKTSESVISFTSALIFSTAPPTSSGYIKSLDGVIVTLLNLSMDFCEYISNSLIESISSSKNSNLNGKLYISVNTSIMPPLILN